MLDEDLADLYGVETRALVQQVRRSTGNREAALGHPADRMTDRPDVVVYIGAREVEPGTSPTRTVRAPRLRHAPRGVDSPRRGKWGPGGLCRYFGRGSGSHSMK